MDNFDFDEWAALAKMAPDEFEQRRRNVLEKLIANSTANNRRLRGLQCRIDMERIRARTPMKACLRLSTLMSDEFINLNTALQNYVDFCQATTASIHVKSSAKIFYIQPDAANASWN